MSQLGEIWWLSLKTGTKRAFHYCVTCVCIFFHERNILRFVCCTVLIKVDDRAQSGVRRPPTQEVRCYIHFCDTFMDHFGHGECKHTPLLKFSVLFLEFFNQNCMPHENELKQKCFSWAKIKSRSSFVK